MPYKSLDDVPESWKTHKGAKLSLEQVNHLAKIYDALKEEGKVDNPAAVAWSQWNKLYKKVGDSYKKISGDIKMAGEPMDPDSNRKKMVTPAINGKCPEGYTLKGTMCFWNDALKKLDEEGKMTDTEKQEEKMLSLFSGETLSKYKSIVEKLEKADTLEVAKGLVSDFKSLIPEEKVEVKEEVKPTKVEEAKVETQTAQVTEATSQKPIEAKQETIKTEEKKVFNYETQLSDALDLNQKMISKLHQAREENSLLTKELSNLKKENSVLTEELKRFVDKEEQAEKQRLQSKFNQVAETYCKILDVPKEEELQVRKMLSTFTEEMLDSTLKHITKKQSLMSENEEQVQTKPSNYISGNETSVMTYEEYKELPAKEKTKFLYNTYLKPKTEFK